MKDTFCDFRSLCTWLLNAYKVNPNRVWSFENDCFDIEKVKRANPSTPPGDIVLATHLMKHEVYAWRARQETLNN